MQKLTNIWVIDDDPIFTFLTKTQITKKFDHVVFESFANGAEAIDELKSVISSDRKCPDLILLDINMPLMDGWEFIEEYKALMGELDQEVFILMVSSTIDIDEIESVKDHKEVQGFMSKPLVMDELNRLLENDISL
jgi:CheY-like chemotaxis protein